MEPIGVAGTCGAKPEVHLHVARAISWFLRLGAGFPRSCDGAERARTPFLTRVYVAVLVIYWGGVPARGSAWDALLCEQPHQPQCAYCATGPLPLRSRFPFCHGGLRRVLVACEHFSSQTPGLPVLRFCVARANDVTCDDSGSQRDHPRLSHCSQSDGLCLRATPRADPRARKVAPLKKDCLTATAT